MRVRIHALMCLVALTTSTLLGSNRWSVRDFGATGDGRTLDTVAVNAAVAAAAEAGGGTVEFPAGEYLCHSIRLQSHITLHLGAGATIIAADPPKPGESGGYDPAEPNPWKGFRTLGTRTGTTA